MSDSKHERDTKNGFTGQGDFRRALGATMTDFGYPAIAAVQAQWEKLRAGRVAPARSQIGPRTLADALPNLFIAELVSPGIARLRLCGQHLNDLVGMEPRGMPVSVLVEPRERDALNAALAQVAQGARVILPLRAPSGLARPALDGRLALLPLTDAQGAITRLLGVLETHGPIGRAPRRLTLGAPGPAVMGGPAVSPRRPAQGGHVLRVIEGGRA